MKKVLIFTLIGLLNMPFNVAAKFYFKRLVENDTNRVIKVTLATAAFGGRTTKATVEPQETKNLELDGSCVKYITVNGKKVKAQKFLKSTISIGPKGIIEMRLKKSGAMACGNMLLTVKGKNKIIIRTFKVKVNILSKGKR